MRVFSGHQPNFLPYMGYFYKMYKSDVFVIDDDVQFSRNSFQNFNFIKVEDQKLRITVPVSYEHGDLINQVRICYEKPWERKFIRTLEMNYGKAPCFDEGYETILRHLRKHNEFLCDLNVGLIEEIATRFGITCDIRISSHDVPTDLKKNMRNLYQCEYFGCDVYYSGIGGKKYNDEGLYAANDIEIVYSDYKPVVYKQKGINFIDDLSVLDYIFNLGFNLPEEWRACNGKE